MIRKTEKIKIIYLIDFFETAQAGTENQLLKLLRYLPRDLFEIYFVSIQRRLFFEELQSQISDVKFKNLDGSADISKSIFTLFRLYQFFIKVKPHILHTFFPAGNSFGVLIGRLAGVPIIISSRRDMGYWYTTKDLMLTRFANLFVSRIVANSYAVRNQTVKLEKCSQKKIQVIYNGIDLKQYRQFLKSLDKPKKPIVAMVANLNRTVKRVDLFIKAAKEIVKRYPDTQFWIFGDGHLRSELEDFVQKLKLSSHVKFWGRLKSIHQYLHEIKLGVNCSDSEGFSNSIMEFMLAGIPVVATNVGGNSELIIHEHNGILVEPNNVDTIVRNITELLYDEKRIKSFGMNSLTSMTEKFNLDLMIKNSTLFYRTLVMNS